MVPGVGPRTLGALVSLRPLKALRSGGKGEGEGDLPRWSELPNLCLFLSWIWSDDLGSLWTGEGLPLPYYVLPTPTMLGTAYPCQVLRYQDRAA